VSSESITLEVDSTQQERDDEDIWRTTQESLVGLVPDPERVTGLALLRWDIEAEYAMKDGFGGCEHRRLFADPGYVIRYASDAWGLRARMGCGSEVGSAEYRRVFGKAAH
jgi:hypothetical protein